MIVEPSPLVSYLMLAWSSAWVTLRGFLQVQVRIQQLIGLLAHEHDQGHQNRDDAGADAQHRGQRPTPNCLN
jgi:hypothetical protein